MLNERLKGSWENLGMVKAGMLDAIYVKPYWTMLLKQASVLHKCKFNLSLINYNNNNNNIYWEKKNIYNSKNFTLKETVYKRNNFTLYLSFIINFLKPQVS